MSKEFVERIKKDNEAFMEASRRNIEYYFNQDLSKEELIEHFIGRAANEYLNLIGISKAVSQMGPEVPVEEMQLISKQAHDEANHFKWVKEVVKHIAGPEFDLQGQIEAELQKPVDDRGANLIARYGMDKDEIMLAVYQMVAEGRAHVAWQQMADMGAVDKTVAHYYANIARDEKFHSQIGERKLEKMDLTPEKEEEIMEFIAMMRPELFKIISNNSTLAPGAYEYAAEAYGWGPREEVLGY
jgi:hypothetical protein